MTIEQRNTLMSLIHQYASASEALGAVDGSYGWNSVYFKQEAALNEVRDYLNSLITVK